jgi:hypothetical protein
MKLSLDDHNEAQHVLSFKQLSRISTLLFVALGIYFAWPFFGVRSFFRQTTTFFHISIGSSFFIELQTLVYICSLAIGLIIAFSFLKFATDKERAKRIAGVNFAWLGFMLEASAGLSLQWIPYDIWISYNYSLLIFFILAVSFLTFSVLLLTDYKWTRKLGYITSCFSFIVNAIILIVIARFFAMFAGPFSTLTALMTVNSSLQICYLFRSNLIKTKDLAHSRFLKIKEFFFSCKVLGTILLSILLVGTFVFLQPINYTGSSGSPTKNVNVGVTFCGDTVSQAKLLVDKVKNYTNVFVVDSWPISQNESALNSICDYAIFSGLHIIVYFAWFNQYWQAFWLDSAKDRWGDMFLGIYLYDEPGGVQLDIPSGKYDNTTLLPINYAAATDKFVQSFRTGNREKSDMEMLKLRGIKAFTSDYALYWFDYEAGYDGLFAEFGWNYSRQLNIALVRGAATILNKDWGIIVTWTYNSWPYIESGDKLYNDMVLAYDNGAKYILVFNYPYNSSSTYGILGEEHFDALAKFWNHKNSNPQPNDSSSSRVAYVLPNDYGYGFRGPNDTIWGVWPADSVTYKIIQNVFSSFQQYGTNLDIVYNSQFFVNNEFRYNKFLFWNETTITST